MVIQAIGASHRTPKVNAHGVADDCKMYGTPRNPTTISTSPKRLPGRRRTQYSPVSTGPRMMSAFCTDSQPGYARKSARSVIHTAAMAATNAARPATSSHVLSETRSSPSQRACDGTRAVIVVLVGSITRLSLPSTDDGVKHATSPPASLPRLGAG